MKNNLFIALFSLVSVAGFAQQGNNTIPKSALRPERADRVNIFVDPSTNKLKGKQSGSLPDIDFSPVQMVNGKTGSLSITTADLGISGDSLKPTTANKAQFDLRAPSITLASLTALTSATPPARVYLSDNGRQGFFSYVSTDSSTPTDGGTVYVTLSGKRYFREFDGLPLLSWFGAIKNDGIDDSPAIQLAINYSVANYTAIKVKAGTYTMSSQVSKPQSFYGLNMDCEVGTIFNYSAIGANLSAFKIIGGSGLGNFANSEFKNAMMIGHSTSVAFEINGQCFQVIRNVVFSTNRLGIRFQNDLSGTFTEYSVGIDCDFRAECQVDLEYKRVSGENSFNGSGLIGNNKINLGTIADGIAGIIIGDGCLVYNAPFSAQIWNTTARKLFQNYNGAPGYFTPYFHGKITLEQFSGSTLTLNTGTPVLFMGPFSTLGDYIDNGTFYRCQAVQYSSATTTAYGISWATSTTLTTGSNTILNAPAGATYLVTISCEATNYNYRYTGIVEGDGFGGAGIWSQLTNGKALNTTPYNAPTITVNSSGQLVITNANYPSSGNVVKATISYFQIGARVYGSVASAKF